MIWLKKFGMWILAAGAALGAMALYLSGLARGTRREAVKGLREDLDAIEKAAKAEEVLFTEAERAAETARQVASEAAESRETERREREADVENNSSGDDSRRRMRDLLKRRRRKRTGRD